MSEEKPLALRVAAGIIATGIEQIKRLPEDLPGLSVTAAGKGVRAWLRLQQELTALAGRGDELLASFSGPPPETAEWATFDDDIADGTTDATSAQPAASEPDSASHGDGSSSDGHSAADSLLPGYDDLTVVEIRAQLRGLDADTLKALWEYELAGQNRASLVTMLGNRWEKSQAESNGTA